MKEEERNGSTLSISQELNRVESWADIQRQREETCRRSWRGEGSISGVSLRDRVRREGKEKYRSGQ